MLVPSASNGPSAADAIARDLLRRLVFSRAGAGRHRDVHEPRTVVRRRGLEGLDLIEGRPAVEGLVDPSVAGRDHVTGVI